MTIFGNPLIGQLSKPLGNIPRRFEHILKIFQYYLFRPKFRYQITLPNYINGTKRSGTLFPAFVPVNTHSLGVFATDGLRSSGSHTACYSIQYSGMSTHHGGYCYQAHTRRPRSAPATDRGTERVQSPANRLAAVHSSNGHHGATRGSGGQRGNGEGSFLLIKGGVIYLLVTRNRVIISPVVVFLSSLFRLGKWFLL